MACLPSDDPPRPVSAAVTGVTFTRDIRHLAVSPWPATISFVPRLMILRLSCAVLLAALGMFPGNPASGPHHFLGQMPATHAPSKSNAASGSSERIRVAEGEYEIFKQTNQGGIGPFGSGVYNFHESWTLWRFGDGSLEVIGKRSYESPKDELHDYDFSVRLSSGFRALGVKEFRKLRWRPDSGPLSCDFLPAKLACTSGAKDPGQNVRLDLPMKNPYGFLWPVSAFSLSNITRFADRNPASLLGVQLVMIDEPGPKEPVFASILDGDLKYLGKEDIAIAQHNWHADKFELKLPTLAPFLIWTAPQGLLLGFAFEDPNKPQPEEGLWLVRFRQWKDF
jgi:hypothetical protein